MTTLRMAAPERREALLDAAWRLIAEDGAAALTLGEVAKRCGVSKPIAYNHFGDRAGLLCALYERYYTDHIIGLDLALRSAETVATASQVIADAYVRCVLETGDVAASLSGAMSGGPEMDAMKRDCDERYLALCATTLKERAGRTPDRVALVGFLGAAASVSHDVLLGQAPQDAAVAFLANLLEQSVSMPPPSPSDTKEL